MAQIVFGGVVFGTDDGERVADFLDGIRQGEVFSLFQIAAGRFNGEITVVARLVVGEFLRTDGDGILFVFFGQNLFVYGKSRSEGRRFAAKDDFIERLAECFDVDALARGC